MTEDRALGSLRALRTGGRWRSWHWFICDCEDRIDACIELPPAGNRCHWAACAARTGLDGL